MVDFIKLLRQLYAASGDGMLIVFPSRQGKRMACDRTLWDVH